MAIGEERPVPTLANSARPDAALQPAPAPVEPAHEPMGMGEEAEEVMGWERRLHAVQVREALQIAAMHEWRRQLAGEESRPVDPSAVPDGVELAEGERVDTNLIFSTFASALPLIYDSVADVRTAPARSVDDTHYELARMFSQTANVVLKREFVEEAKLKDRMRALARSTMCESLGWVKMAYARDYDRQPHLRMRPEDAQDEIVRLQSLAERLPEVVDPDERTMMVEQIRGLKEALFEQRDVLVSEGLVIDLLQPTDVVVSSEVVCLASGYRQAEWIAQGIWLTAQDAAARYRLTETESRTVRQYGADALQGRGETAITPGGASRPDIVDGGSGPGGGTMDGGYCRAWEIWHRTGVRVLTLLEGLRRWARPPMRPERRPQRWYPFYNVAFNHVEHRRYPLSDVKLLGSLQAEFQRLREKFMKHRDATVPKTAVDGSKVDATDMQTYKDAPVGSIVPLSNTKGLSPETPIENAFFTPQVALPTPALYDSASVVGDMERVFGMGDAMRGAVVTPKTATEAKQMQAATGGRMGERTNELITLEEEMAEDALEILLMELSLERVRQMAGASAVWPQLDRATIYQMVSLTVMHESKADRERKAALWMELAPQIQAMVMQIAQLRMAGMSMIAEPVIEIMRETLRRYDERIDIERFLPGGPHQAGVPLPAELQDAAAGQVAPVNAQMLTMLMAIMQGGMMPAPGGPGTAQGGGGPTAGGQGYNPAAGGMGPPQAQGASVQSGGVT